MGFEDKIGIAGTKIIKKGKREAVECLAELAASNRYDRRLMLLKEKAWVLNEMKLRRVVCDCCIRLAELV